MTQKPFSIIYPQKMFRALSSSLSCHHLIAAVLLFFVIASSATAQCPPWKVGVTKVFIEIDDWRTDKLTAYIDFPLDFDWCLVDDISKCWDIQVHTISLDEDSPLAERLLALYICSRKGLKADFLVSDFGVLASNVPLVLEEGIHRDLLSKMIEQEVTSVYVCSDHKYLTDLRFDQHSSDRATIYSSEGDVVMRFY